MISPGRPTSPACWRKADAHASDDRVPQAPLPEEADAIVVALKSRSSPVAEAIAESLEALELAARGRVSSILLQVLLRLIPPAKATSGQSPTR